VTRASTSFQSYRLSTNGRHADPRNVVRLVALAAALGILLAVAWTYLPFIADDALISFRYSDRLLAGSGLTFTDGEWVEGYSNLLWVLIVALGGVLSNDLILVARWAGVSCMAVTLTAIARSVLVVSGPSLLPLLAGLSVVALSHGMAIWMIGGLEQPLLTALLACTFAFLLGREQVGSIPRAASIVLALVVITRPDGALIVALFALGLLLAHGASWARLADIAALSVLPALTWLAHLAFRLWYYGDWVPNTAYVKLSWSGQHSLDGLRYVITAAIWHAPMVALGVVAVATTRPMWRRHVILPLVVALGWAAYVIFIGGDIFPGRRHFVPVVVCGAFMLALTWRSSILGRLPLIAQGVVLLVASTSYLTLHSRDPQNIRAHGERWEWECARLAALLASAFSRQAPLIAADPVGCIGYFARLPTLDLMGLNDRHIARTRPRDFGSGLIGHELGDGRYVFGRKPDLVLLCGPRGSSSGCFRSGIELLALPEFRREYVLIGFLPEGASYPSRIWIRTTSPRIGVSDLHDLIRVPGFLFASGETFAVLAADRQLATRIPPRGVVHFTALPHSAESWQVRVTASGEVTTFVHGSTVTVAAGPQGSDLTEVVLSRYPQSPKETGF
jgi:arabinofuranosyltransferase